ncbi:MAG: NlpC/P60 family protein [Lentilitoribacter sp.]
MQKYLGIPYVEHGRHYNGADCWGVVFLFYRDELKTPVPSYSQEMYERRFKCRDIGPLIEQVRDLNWVELKQPVFGACVVIRNGNFNTHVGVYLGNNKILHSETDCSRIERMDSMNLRGRIVGFYSLK